MSVSSPQAFTRFPKEALGNVEQPISVAFGDQWAIRGKAEKDVWELYKPFRFGLLLLLGMAVPLTLSPDGFLGTLAKNLQDSGNQAQIGDSFAFVAAMMLLFGIPTTVKAIANFRRRHFGAPIILHSQPSFRVGDTFDLEFVREAEAGQYWPSGKFTMQVVCEEVTRVEKGTDVSYTRVQRWNSEAKTFGVSSGQTTISGRISVTVPDHLPPNSATEGHWIFWKIVILQEFGIRFAEKNEYLLHVFPNTDAHSQTRDAQLRLAQSLKRP